MPRASALTERFARAEAALREEIAAAEAAVAKAEEKKATAAGRLEELLRVRELVAGAQPVAEKVAMPRAKAKGTVKSAPRASGSLPGPGTATRAIFDAVAAGACSYQAVREATGFTTDRITGILPGLVRRGLVVRSAKDEYAPAEGVG